MPNPLTSDTNIPIRENEDGRLSRRRFMQWLGTGGLVAGLLPACRRVDRYLVPYNQGPEWTVPGLPTVFATCMPGIRSAVPLMAVCRDGRPTKLEPSPSWPLASGLSSWAQASLFGLYDPARSRKILFHGKPAARQEVQGAFASWAKKTVGKGKCAFLVGDKISPVERALLEELRKRNPGIRVFHWEPLSDAGRRMAVETALQPGVVAVPRLNRVRRLLALDCDWMGTDPQGVASEFMQGRIPDDERSRTIPGSGKDFNRFYAVEGRFSLSGGMADHRLSLLPSAIPLFLWELARRIGSLTENACLRDLPAASAPVSGEWNTWLDACAEDLCSHSSQSLVLLGWNYPQPLHSLVLEINSALKAPGVTLSFLQGEKTFGESLGLLPEAVRQGEVETLFLLGESNPVRKLPPEWDFRGLLESPNLESVHLGLYVDETAQACDWHFPAAHYLESWGIERDEFGRFCYMQPVTLPLYGGYSRIEFLSGLMNSKGRLLSADNAPGNLSPAFHRVRKCFERAVNPVNKEAGWTDALRRGFSPETVYAPLMKNPSPPSQETLDACLCLAETPPPAEGQREVQFVPDYAVWDGRFLTNAWLRELPDPVTGLCWDGSVQIAPDAVEARTMEGKCHLLRVEEDRRCFGEGVACLVPGMPDNLLVIPLGYGGSSVADAGSHAEGNTWTLASSPAAIPYVRRVSASSLRLLPAEKRSIALLPPVSEGDIPVPVCEMDSLSSASPAPESPLWMPPHANDIHQWGMCIDLSLCTGCNACLSACQAENNIPTVGREEVARDRIMHWIRIDRYFRRTEGGNVSLQAFPVACQQCAKAPCESVCPVNATVHTTEGINAMTYARCWGTRYCAANCPYKARRFNFFDYARFSDEATRLQRNPNVTIRSRGVMEKCTYCVQRIEEAKIRHKAQLMSRALPGRSAELELTDKDLLLPEGAVRTACQAACPMEAISFGNLLDKSRIAMLRQSPRHFTGLSEMGTLPRTSYLARTVNSNPELVRKQNSKNGKRDLK